MGSVDDLVARIEFEDDVTAVEADRCTRDLVRRLERLDVDDVRMAEEENGADTRTGGLTAIAGLVLVSGIAVRHVLTPLVAAIGAWLERTGQKSVTIEKGGATVTVTGAVKAEDVQAYVRALDALAVPENPSVSPEHSTADHEPDDNGGGS